MADGLGGASREEALAIMRDSRIGVFGVLALIFAVALKAAALAALLDAGGSAALAVPTAAAAWSRAVLPCLLHALPPARNDGLGAAAGAPSRTAVWQALLVAWIGGLIALWPISLFLGLIGIPLACLAGAAAVGWLADRRLGGQTGDVAGAVQVMSEVAALLVAAAWLGP
jgi:adenosylcobinamide-GDP ribazoletransferase